MPTVETDLAILRACPLFRNLHRFETFCANAVAAESSETALRRTESAPGSVSDATQRPVPPTPHSAAQVPLREPVPNCTQEPLPVRKPSNSVPYDMPSRRFSASEFMPGVRESERESARRAAAEQRIRERNATEMLLDATYNAFRVLDEQARILRLAKKAYREAAGAAYRRLDAAEEARAPVQGRGEIRRTANTVAAASLCWSAESLFVERLADKARLEAMRLEAGRHRDIASALLRRAERSPDGRRVAALRESVERAAKGTIVPDSELGKMLAENEKKFVKCVLREQEARANHDTAVATLRDAVVVYSGVPEHSTFRRQGAYCEVKQRETECDATRTVLATAKEALGTAKQRADLSFCIAEITKLADNIWNNHRDIVQAEKHVKIATRIEATRDAALIRSNETK